MKYFLICLLFCLISFYANAQEGKNFNNNKIIGVPAKNQPKDSVKNQLKDKKADLQKTEQKTEEAKTESGKEEMKNGFQMYKDLSLANEDTLTKKLGELQVVKVSEELKIDCVWVKAAEYYAIWDSKNINPYRRDASQFKDTIDFVLYNYALGQLWSSPLDKTIQTSSFGYRWGTFHHGIDLDLKIGTPVYSVFDGIVRISAYGAGFGNYVVVRHRNGLETLYAHLSNRKVEVGQVIKAGQLLGLGGSTGWSTGPHLHFEVRYEGNSFNPLSMYDFSKDDVLISDTFRLMPYHFAHLGNKVRIRLIHKVLPGETLSTISLKYNVPVATLAKLNQIMATAILKTGQQLIIK